MDVGRQGDDIIIGMIVSHVRVGGVGWCHSEGWLGWDKWKNRC